jgi:predicted nuclease of predicted toxin-antitoxin system
MKIKLDENLPVELADVLAKLNHVVDTVASEGLKGRDDGIVWSAAQHEGRFLITQDLDFSDIRLFAPGTHHSIMLVRLTQPGRLALTERVRTVFQTEDVETWPGAFVVATDRKIRVRRPH